MPGPQGVTLLEGDLVGGCVSLRVGFEDIYAQATPSVSSHFLLPTEQDAELSTPPPAPCLHLHETMSHYDDNGLNLWNYNSPPIKCFHLKRNKNPNKNKSKHSSLPKFTRKITLHIVGSILYVSLFLSTEDTSS